MTRTLPALTLGLIVALARPASAQQDSPPPQEKPPVVENAPPPLPTLPADGCCAPPIKALWIDQLVPVQTLVPRPVKTVERVSTVVVATRPEKRTVTHLVFEPRETERPVTTYVMEPVTTTDCHGHCTTVMQPCPQVKMVKGVVWVPVCKEETVVVEVPYLTVKDVPVEQTQWLLEWRTSFAARGCAVAVPGPELGVKERTHVLPQPPCPGPEHPE